MSSITVALEVYNIVLGIIFFISILLRHYLTDKVQGWFKWIVLNNIILSAADICRFAFAGTSSPVNNILFPASVFLMYAASFAIVITTEIEIMLFVNQKRFKTFLIISMVITSTVFFTFLILTPSIGLLYTINPDNTFTRGRYLFVPFALQVFTYFSLLIFVVGNRKAIGLLKLICIGTFILIPQFAQIIQIIKPGISLVPCGYTIAFLIMFIFANRRLEEYLDYTEVELDEKSTELNEKVSEIERSKVEFIKMQNHTIESLSNLVENRDEDTGEHVRRTRAYVELLAVQLMKDNRYADILNPRYIRFLKRAAPMHDIGKIVVPDAILKKPGRLTDSEFSTMKLHAAEGGRIVHEILDGYEDPEYVQITADIAKHHHEKWNGTGYPDHLTGDEIPLCSRIMAIADVFDALVSPRIYKSPMSYDEAFAIIEASSGEHFDPVVAQEFLKIREKAEAINESFRINV